MQTDKRAQHSHSGPQSGPTRSSRVSPSARAIIVLTTTGADSDPIALAHALVDERLAACVNVLPPMTSVYRWKGEVAEDAERQLVIKTRPERIAALKERLLALHPYELPEFLVLDADGSEAYLAWVRQATE
jgi:periplasmic divalent cation tolerance protein